MSIGDLSLLDFFAKMCQNSLLDRFFGKSGLYYPGTETPQFKRIGKRRSEGQNEYHEDDHRVLLAFRNRLQFAERRIRQQRKG